MDTVDETDGDAPRVRDAVGDDDSVLLLLTVGVDDGVPIPEPVLEAVGVTVSVALGVALPLREMEPVLDGLIPADRDAVGDSDTVELEERAKKPSLKLRGKKPSRKILQ